MSGPTVAQTGVSAGAAVRRGGILLEVMLAIALMVMGGVAVLGALNQTGRGVEAARQQQRAADIARTAMALIEAGIATPESLHGPVPTWETDPHGGYAQLWDDAGPGEFGPGFDDTPPEPSGWEVEIETWPTEFEGLTRVSVRAFRRASAGSERATASYTFRQLVRLGAREEDSAGDEDELMGAARRGAQLDRGGGR